MNNLPAIIPIETIATLKALAENRLPDVRCQDDYDLAAVRRRELKSAMKALDTERKKLTQPLDAQKKEIMDFCRPLEADLSACEAHHAQLMRAWDAEQQRIRDEEQRRINEAMRIKAEAEKAALEAKALAAVKKGKDDLAERLIVEAEAVEPAEIVLAAHKPITPGVHYRTTIKGEVADRKAFLRWVVENSAFWCIEFRPVELNRVAKDAFENSCEIPGLKITEVKTLI